MKNSVSSVALFVLAQAWVPALAGEVAVYPTVDRVQYVIDCMRDTPGPKQELLYKCSCAIDAIAQRMSYEEYVEDSTVSNALTIGGERGEVMRGYTSGRAIAKRLRQVQADARKACFLP